MTKLMPTCIALFLAFSLASAARADDKYPLRAIEVTGAEIIPAEKIIALSGLKIGQPAGESDFRQALHNLGQAGVFESLQYNYRPEGDGYRLTLVVEEVDQLYPLRIKGFDDAEEDLFKLIAERVPLFVGKVPPSGPMLETVGAVLQAHWRKSGHDSKVDGRVAPTGEDEFEILFEPRERIQTIALVRFHNAGVVEELELQRSFNKVAMGVPYSEARLLELLHHNVRPLYEELGRMEVKFCPCTTEPDAETEGLLVTVEIEEGPPFTFGTITLPEESPVGADRIAKAVEVSEGDPVNMQAVHESLAKLEESLKRQGYMKAQAILEADIDKQAKKVHLDIALNLGSQYKMGKLEITGLDILSEPAVRKRWGIEIGEPFDISYPAFFLEVLRREAMFDGLERTKWTMQTDEVNKTIAVTLKFVGKAEAKKPDYSDVRKPDIF